MASLEDAGLHVSVERILYQLCVKKKEMNSNTYLDHNGIIHRNNNNNDDNDDEDNHSDDDADDYEALERNLMSPLQADPSVASRRYRVQHHCHENDHSLIDSSSSPPSPSHLPNEEGFLLLHHLCVTVPVPSLYTCSVGLLQKVFESYPEAVVNDPAIMVHLLRRPGERGHVKGALLDLIGMVGEQWPQAYQVAASTYQKMQRDLEPHLLHLRTPSLRSALSCGWRRLVDSVRTGASLDERSAKQPLLYQTYPHLMQHMASISVDFDGIDEPEQEAEENNALISARGENAFIRSQRIRQMLQQLINSKGITSLHRLMLQCYVSSFHDGDLMVSFPCIGEVRANQWDLDHQVTLLVCCRRWDSVDEILSFFGNNAQSSRGGERLPIAILHVTLPGIFDGRTRATLDSIVMQVTRHLPAFPISECILRGRVTEDPIPCDCLNSLFGMVAEHPTIQRLELGTIPVQSHSMNLGNLARLCNLESLTLNQMDLRNSVVPPLAQLVQASDRLQMLDIGGNGIVDAELLLEAVGRSPSLRTFNCNFDQTRTLESMMHHIERFNTTLLSVSFESYVKPPFGTFLHRQQVDGGNVDDVMDSTQAMNRLLRERIYFLLKLNACGRGRLRQRTLTKDEFIVDILGPCSPSVASPFTVTSLQYWLLRHNPEVWCK